MQKGDKYHRIKIIFKGFTMNKYFLLSAAALMLTVAPLAAQAADAKAPAAKSAIDTNNDGFVSKSEADAVAGRDFAAFDTNKDGKISQDEFKALLYKTNAAQLPDDAAKKKVEPEIMGQFKMLDHNKDGNISKAEFLEDSTRRFKAMDENGDGKVSKDEVADVQKKIQAQVEKMKEAYEKKKAAEKK